MKLLKIIGCFLLMICSTVYTYRQPEIIRDTPEQHLTITLTGAFKINGEYAIHDEMTMSELVREVGVRDDACLAALDLTRVLSPEESFYLPVQRDEMISLNHATKEDFMKLKGVGEKTAEKLIAYRQETPYTCLEDIMKVNGIGEKRYLQYRDMLCL